ncbi:MAG TPA: heavy metal-binding domain-containing protein [Fibrobacteria bacterium]|jgi:hypothetical protein|nr:heavy metal-binding domain-containing protein [Fibrobacteria bacterium]
MRLRFSPLAFILLSSSIAASVLTGCKKEEQVKGVVPEAKASAYHCPMHPQIVKDAPGSCPICGMTLVPITAPGEEHQAGAGKYPVIELSAEMIKTLKIRTEKIRLRDSSGIFIPSKALVRTENRMRVVVALGGGRFQPRPVEIGEETSDSVSIVSGLKEGEEIVLSGQFLLDSESSLRSSVSSAKAK